MSRKVTLFIAGLAFALAAVFGVTQLSLYAGGSANAQTADTYRQLNLFGEVFERILANYVDEITETELIEAAIRGMILALDPHSDYMAPVAYQELTATNRGEFGGLGIEVTMENEVIRVVSPIAESPADRAGILAGDLIIGLDGALVQGKTLQEAIDIMRGEVGTPITITVLRQGVADPFDVVIVRDVIRVTSVRYEAFGTIGYIRINQFTDTTTPGLQDAIAALTAQIGPMLITGFVLDLRNNPGGLLDQSVSVVDAFVEQGEILTTRGRYEENTRRYTARTGDLINGLPLILLINGGSASASEIVAGALQDHRRATLVGTLSFGKGSVQTIIPLAANQGALRLTTARYFTPSGRSIQARGISPDIRVTQILPPEILAQLQALPPQGEAALPGHLAAPGGADEQVATYDLIPRDRAADTQLQYALSLMRGEILDPAFPPNPAAGPPL